MCRRTTRSGEAAQRVGPCRRCVLFVQRWLQLRARGGLEACPDVSHQPLLALFVLRYRSGRHQKASRTASSPPPSGRMSDSGCGLVRHTRGTFVSPRGPALRTHAWQPKEANHAQANTACELFILHGYGAHGAFPTVRILAEHLASRGFTCRSLDFEGCGESEGLPGLINDYGDLVTDALAFVEAQRVVTEKPAFILGTSAGGALALKCTTIAPAGTFAGCVLLSPMVVIAEAAKPGALAQRALRVLGELAPAWRLCLFRPTTCPT